MPDSDMKEVNQPNTIAQRADQVFDIGQSLAVAVMPIAARYLVSLLRHKRIRLYS